MMEWKEVSPVDCVHNGACVLQAHALAHAVAAGVQREGHQRLGSPILVIQAVWYKWQHMLPYIRSCAVLLTATHMHASAACACLPIHACTGHAPTPTRRRSSQC